LRYVATQAEVNSTRTALRRDGAILPGGWLTRRDRDCGRGRGFDYSDTSGEVADQTQAHRARVASFAELLREDIAAGGAYRVVQLDCPEHPCTAGTMPPDDFVAAARRAGARLVIYGGIRKMSTLVQWGQVQLLDLQRNEVVLQRTVSFRGDNDTAFRRAAAFVGKTLKDVMPRP
jgi:hypothetical protein